MTVISKGQFTVYELLFTLILSHLKPC